MKQKKVRYAVVGLGHIAQVAVLPAFKHARANSELTALVSRNPQKLKQLSKKYKVNLTCDYSEFEALLDSRAVDAVYISTPNTIHQRLVEKAAALGVHILCEKPMTLTSRECQSMIQAVEKNKVKLMIAYRLHFEAANLEAMKIAHSGKLGELKVFNSAFTMQVRDKNNIRLDKQMGGGTLYDIGIYCINAARHFFRTEPVEVFAKSLSSKDKRFSEVDEMTSVILTFPDTKLAAFTSSFGAASNSSYDVIGTRGRVRVKNGYDYAMPMEVHVSDDDDNTRVKKYPKRDQFAPELIYFSTCILKNRQPEPDGTEGLADVRIIEALLESAKSGRPVSLPSFEKKSHPTTRQRITRPAVAEPDVVHAPAPGG